jgi:hypothetical protein
VIGVFTAFTLAQSGMVRHWQKTRERGWRWRAGLNALGAATTALVTVVVVATKFLDGAWMVLIAIPLLVLAFYGVRRHYRSVGRRLRAKGRAVLCSREVENNVILYVEATRRRHPRGALVRADDLEGVAARDPRAVPGQRPGHRPALLPLDRRRSAARDPARRRRPARRGARGDLGDPAGREPYVTVVVPELFRKPRCSRP